MYDFPDKELGKAIPYGVYDLVANEGWVSVGVDSPTRRRLRWRRFGSWSRQMGLACHGGAQRLLITADGGGSNCQPQQLLPVEVGAAAACRQC